MKGNIMMGKEVGVIQGGGHELRNAGAYRN